MLQTAAGARYYRVLRFESIARASRRALDGTGKEDASGFGTRRDP